jgi:hypothetical protein
MSDIDAVRVGAAAFSPDSGDARPRGPKSRLLAAALAATATPGRGRPRAPPLEPASEMGGRGDGVASPAGVSAMHRGESGDGAAGAKAKLGELVAVREPRPVLSRAPRRCRALAPSSSSSSDGAPWRSPTRPRSSSGPASSQVVPLSLRPPGDGVTASENDDDADTDADADADDADADVDAADDDDADDDDLCATRRGASTLGDRAVPPSEE